MFNNLFRCIVEDNKDPKHMGRIKLRVVGVHDKKLELVPTEKLPWTHVLNPIDAGNTLGSSTNVLIGTWGYCTPLNESLTEFLFIGTIKGTFTEKPLEVDDDGDAIGFRDPSGKFPVRLNQPDNRLTYGELQDNDITQPRVQVAEFNEPTDTARNATYPNNKVYEDHNGNFMEVDGTPENPRFRFQHSTGARIEINVKGDVTIQTLTGNIYQQTAGLFAMGADGNLIIGCDVKIMGSLEVIGDIANRGNIKSDGDIEDKLGTLDSLRIEHDKNVSIFNAHIHLSSDPTNHPPTVITATPEAIDPQAKWGDFKWVGTPL